MPLIRTNLIEEEFFTSLKEKEELKISPRFLVWATERIVTLFVEIKEVEKEKKL